MFIEPNQKIHYPIEQLRSNPPDYNLIYCYKSNITIEGQELPCRPEVFRIPYKSSFKTAKFTYKIDTRKINMTQKIPILTSDVHPTHYDKPIVDLNFLLDTIERMKGFDIMNREQISNFMSEHKVAISAGSGSTLLIIMFAIWCICHILKLKQMIIQRDLELSQASRTLKKPTRDPPPAPVQLRKHITGAC